MRQHPSPAVAEASCAEAALCSGLVPSVHVNVGASELMPSPSREPRSHHRREPRTTVRLLVPTAGTTGTGSTYELVRVDQTRGYSKNIPTY
eukprot:SAG31_NODE_192_length_20788_cov_8.938083_14_plen_91_part_00